MKTYGWNDTLPDLPLSPRDPDYECNQCGCLFDLPPIRMRDPDGEDDRCPECDSRDIHRT
ncbi:hypothetical protein LCGC14_2711050 [marine sediment metagenome]|uniref:Uncharacterized protein n=1 Tax=marine sediment metagenome TaxID=412755 RepID=A0A0F9C4L7_9ZZZZ